MCASKSLHGFFLKALLMAGWLALQQRILSPCPDAGLQASPLRALRSDQEDEVGQLRSQPVDFSRTDDGGNWPTS